MAENRDKSRGNPSDSATILDLLGFEKFILPLGNRISYIDIKETPLTIGVYGPWGSGKTSALKMLEVELQNKKCFPVWFNAWKYSKEENLWSALIQKILDEAKISGPFYRRLWVRFKIWRSGLKLRAGSFEVLKKIFLLLFRLALVFISMLIVLGWTSKEFAVQLDIWLNDWFSNATTLTIFKSNISRALIIFLGYLAANPAQLFKLFKAKLGVDFSKFKKTGSYRAQIAFLDEFIKEFKKIIKLVGGGKPVVVFIDDLDRCLPAKCILVLEAIKLFLDVQGCIFIIAADRKFIEDAVAVEYKEVYEVTGKYNSSEMNANDGNSSFGKEYFEKIVQLPFALPPISDEQFEYFVSNVYADNEYIKLCLPIFSHCTDPRNPRKVKRQLQLFLFLIELAAGQKEEGDIKIPLLAKLVIIQSQFGDLYEAIIETRPLLEALELYFKKKTTTTTETEADERKDPVLQAKVEKYATENPKLEKLLTIEVNPEDTFRNIDLSLYIFLVISAPTRSTDEGMSAIRTSLTSEKQYLRYVLSITKDFKTYGMLQTSRETSVDDFFMSPRFTKLNEDIPLDLPEMLKASLHSVILGAPGTGKTALLSYLSYIFAGDYSQIESRLVENRLGVPDRLMPLFFRFREIETYLEKNDSFSATSGAFLEFLNDYFMQREMEDMAAFFESYLTGGRCILLFDGLDEVSPDKRFFMVKMIASLVNRYSTIRIIVSSRLYGYENIDWGQDFQLFKIEEFDSQSVIHFVENWCAVNFEHDQNHQQRAEEIIAAITKYEQISVLARNPLLLMMMLSLYDKRGQLPTSRVTLIDEGIESLLSQWDSVRGIIIKGYNSETAREVLTEIAFGLLVQNRREFDNSWVRREKIFKDEQVGDSKSLLETIAERTGILVKTSPGYFSFSHMIMQEHFASKALVRRKDVTNLILKNYKDSKWQEVIVFAIVQLTNAQELIETLVEENNIEAVIVAGRCIVEVGYLFDQAITTKTVRLLKNFNVSQDTSLEQLKITANILKSLGIEVKDGDNGNVKEHSVEIEEYPEKVEKKRFRDYFKLKDNSEKIPLDRLWGKLSYKKNDGNLETLNLSKNKSGLGVTKIPEYPPLILTIADRDGKKVIEAKSGTEGVAFLNGDSVAPNPYIDTSVRYLKQRSFTREMGEIQFEYNFLDKLSDSMNNPVWRDGEFFGREQAVNQIKRNFSRANESPYNILITGMENSGKTSLLRYLHHEFFPFYDLLPHKYVTVLEEFNPKDEIDFAKFRGRVQAQLDQIDKGNRGVIVLIDNYDKAFEHFGNEFGKLLREYFREDQYYLIIAGRKGANLLGKKSSKLLSQWTKNILIGGENENNSKQLLDFLLTAIGFPHRYITSEAKDRIVNNSSGFPFWIKNILFEVLNDWLRDYDLHPITVESVDYSSKKLAERMESFVLGRAMDFDRSYNKDLDTKTSVSISEILTHMSRIADSNGQVKKKKMMDLVRMSSSMDGIIEESRARNFERKLRQLKEMGFIQEVGDELIGTPRLFFK